MLTYVAPQTHVILGLRDIQVWLSAFSYMGIIVSLYSFSLFLYVLSSARRILLKFIFKPDYCSR